MTRDTIASLASALLPLVLLALAAFAAWAGRLVSRYVRDRRYALAVELIALGAAGVVADLFQHVVADLKDPSKAGRWDAVAAAAVKLRAVARLRELYPHAAATITGVLTDPSKVDSLFGTFVEKGVVELKGRATSSAVLNEMVVNVEGRATVAPGVLADAVNEATTAGRQRLPTGVLGAMVLVCLTLGCGSTDGATAALATATTAIKAAATVRQYLCARELDPLLGDPRPSAPSSGGTAPTPAPAPSLAAVADASAPGPSDAAVPQ